MTLLVAAPLATQTARSAASVEPVETPVPTQEPTQEPTDPPPTQKPTSSPTETPTESPTEQPEPTEKPYDPVKAGGSASPRELVRPGEVTVSIKLTNNGDDAIPKVTIYNAAGDVVMQPMTLGLGKSYTWKEKVAVKESQLDSGVLNYKVTYMLAQDTPNERTVSKNVKVAIKRAKAAPKAEFTRSISSPIAYKGQTVTLSYTVRNAGNVPLTKLTIKDALFGTVGKLDSLGVDKKKTFTKKLEITKGVTSSPKLTFKASGASKTHTASVKSASIRLAKAQLEATLEADKIEAMPGDEVKLTYTVSNRGNVDYRKLRMSDDVLGEILGMPSELKAGESYVYNTTVTAKADTTFRFTVTGTDATGRDITETSNAVTVRVTPAIQTVKLRLEASTESPKLSQTGEVLFTLYLENEGDSELTDVMISEATQGDIRSIAVVPLGVTKLEHSYTVDATTTFVFSATLTNPVTGDVTSVNSNRVEIAFELGEPASGVGGEETESPELTPEPTLPPVPQESPEGVLKERQETPGSDLFQLPDPLSIIKVAIGVVGVMIAACVGALMIHNRRRRHRVQLRRINAGRQRQALTSNRPTSATRQGRAPGRPPRPGNRMTGRPPR